MESGLSTGDLALMSKDDGMFGGGGAFMWIFALLILAGGGFGGWGNGNNAATQATTADIQRAVDLNAIQQGQSGIAADVQRGIYEINSATKDAAYNNLSEIRDVQASIAAGFANQQTCCCETQRAIDGVNYNLANNTASINANTTAQVQKVLDAIATNRMADMQNQINQLQLANAVSGVVRYPMSSTWSMSGNPFCGSGCSCGNV